MLYWKQALELFQMGSEPVIDLVKAVKGVPDIVVGGEPGGAVSNGLADQLIDKTGQVIGNVIGGPAKASDAEQDLIY